MSKIIAPLPSTLMYFLYYGSAVALSIAGCILIVWLAT